MKKLLILLSLVISTTTFAVDESVFAGTYQSFQDYQAICLQGFNNYFSALLNISIVTGYKDHSYKLEIQDENEVVVKRIKVSIERIQTSDSFVENVVFTQHDSTTLSYFLKREGSHLTPTPDLDLLTFNLAKITGPFDLYIKEFNVRFQKMRPFNGVEKAYILLGVMEIDILIETTLGKNEAIRNYVYYTKEITPDAHVVLSVRAVGLGDDLQTKKFIHSVRGSEISPSVFFEGLSQGSQMFSVYSMISLQIIKQMGFPAIPGIN